MSEPVVTARDPEGNPTRAIVPVKSAWFSKINWLQAAGAATAIVTAFQLDIPMEYKPHALVAMNFAQATLTWIARTWFNNSVTPPAPPTSTT